ncbi:hypothetical protein SAMN04487895_12759 [Paenibacillus sophorae]|uniref:XRE family transcriptional regulator n=1 Tax=Paenibacillus sophorae TaxID=1333845 RepID=A0A1H8VTW1_9BACL|nr:hypothetical protein [Paenibacillus sophorae]QWU15711.1 XRE family transcriptional regulator [Paenibacillus sophorae]SEP18831.1 hypothetical protein SAMN04487895_12759 [Paenibacillus sophorae]
MTYAELIKQGIAAKKMSLGQVCMKLAKKDLWVDRAILSKLQNGNLPPAKDHINKALAEIIEIDEIELRLAAARELIPSELFELIRSTGNQEIKGEGSHGGKNRVQNHY